MSRRKLAVYRPGKVIEKGYAFQFSGSARKNGDRVMFVEGTRQVREKPEAGSSASPFEWKNKVIVMLNSGELATLAVAIIDGNEAVFTHKTPKGSSVTKFRPPDGERSRDWYVSISNTRNIEGGQPTQSSVAGFISQGDIYTIKLMCDQLIVEDVYSGVDAVTEQAP
jgi:hypothetical protein